MLEGRIGSIANNTHTTVSHPPFNLLSEELVRHRTRDRNSSIQDKVYASFFFFCRRSLGIVLIKLYILKVQHRRVKSARIVALTIK